MLKQIISQAEDKMKKSIEAVKVELATIRTGRASASLVEHIMVDCYGSPAPLNQVAGISVPETQLIIVQPWDKNIISDVEKAIIKANIGLTPINDGKVLRIPVPSPTEERRKELIKIVKKIGEEGKISIRGIRRDTIAEIKNLQKNGQVPEDDAFRDEEHIQKITDQHIGQIDEVVGNKEKALMAI
ncbi:MAG: ribosome recycling factor [bacterium]|nr:ribosome recycling factor [bacterium]